MTNAKLNKWVLVALVFLLINVAGWFLGLDPLLNDRSNVQDEMAALYRRKEQLSQRLEYLAAIDVDVLEQQWAQLNLRLPEQGYLREFLIELESAARQLNLTLHSIRAGAPGQAEGFKALGMTVVVEGQYRDIYNYIAYLEKNERLVPLDSLSLNSSGESVNATIQLRIYAEDFDGHTPHAAPGRSNPFR